MQNQLNYERAKFAITVFDQDGIHTDIFAGSAPSRPEDFLPVFTVGAPLTGVGGSKMGGQRDING